jgi:hypothetical protein
MRHKEQDGVDARGRAAVDYRPDWHPLLAAVETSPGEWVMVAQHEVRYAVIRLLELGGERGYRVVTWAERSEDRRLIGYYRTLRAAAMAGHLAFVRSHSRDGFAPRPWG